MLNYFMIDENASSIFVYIRSGIQTKMKLIHRYSPIFKVESRLEVGRVSFLHLSIATGWKAPPFTQRPLIRKGDRDIGGHTR